MQEHLEKFNDDLSKFNDDLGSLGTLIVIAWIICVLTVVFLFLLPLLIKPRASSPPRSDDNQK